MSSGHTNRGVGMIVWYKIYKELIESIKLDVE